MILNIEGGRGSGKSTTAAKVIARLIEAPGAVYGQRFAVVCRQGLLPTNRELIENAPPEHEIRAGRADFIPEVGAATNLRGHNYAGIWLDEPDDWEDIYAIWESARTACRVHPAVMIVSSTPQPDGFVASVIRPHTDAITIAPVSPFTERHGLLDAWWSLVAASIRPAGDRADGRLREVVGDQGLKICESLGFVVLDDSESLESRLRAADALVRMMEARPW